MKILIVGGGGREHAIAAALCGRDRQLFAAPGNGGMEEIAKCLPIAATECERIAEWSAANGMDYVVVAPDDPLAMGLCDMLSERGIPSFGPTAAAAQIEASKVFSKGLMKKYHIPTADYESFTDEAAALSYVEKRGKYPVVIKADGLALGKGVVIAESLPEAAAALRSMMSERIFGASGDAVVIEEFLTGPEVSVLCFTDGERIAPMVSSMDHKRAHDGDTGKNTGGMGTVAPNPFYTEETAQRCMEEIFLPTVRAMAAEGRPFSGCLYFGLMLTEDGPKVIEYNCRFGDPETQVVLPMLDCDLYEIMRDVSAGALEPSKVRLKSGAACCVVAASGGYPEKYEKGKEITVGADIDALLYHAGTKRTAEGKLVTSGGRVLGVVKRADTLKEAVDAAYREIEKISFDGMFYRRDIGERALAQTER